jgi:murein DD-endopeptidase
VKRIVDCKSRRLLPAFLYAALLCAALLHPAPLRAAETEAAAAEDASTNGASAAAPAGAPALRSRLVAEALSYTGTRYTYAGTNRRTGFDCSGLVYRVYLDVADIRFPRMVEDLYREGEPVAKGRLLPGDLVFFNTLGYISHVGMYIGEGTFVHAENEKNGVLVTALSSDYYTRTYVGARRHISGDEASGRTGPSRVADAGKDRGKEEAAAAASGTAGGGPPQTAEALYALFDGRFASSFGPMELEVLDPFGNVRGEYHSKEGIGRIWGRIDPEQRAFIGRWSHTGNRGSVQGEVRFFLTDNGDGLKGYWRRQGRRDWQENWDAVRR